MVDYFALFAEPRRPCVDADALKTRFLAFSAEVHPDRVHTASAAERDAAQRRYVELNAAYHCLREPKERLRHLLELERGAKPEVVQNIPPDLMDQFLEVSQLCRAVDAFLQEKRQVNSPLLKVQMFERGLERTDHLNALQQKLNAQREALLEELSALNAAWESAPAPGTSHRPDSLPLARLEQIYRLLSFLGRWSGQLQERVVQLSM
jgi:DnaJ-domain-containing protein 1